MRYHCISYIRLQMNTYHLSVLNLAYFALNLITGGTAFYYT